jgi:cell division protein ZapA
MQRPVQVEIMGQQLTLSTDEGVEHLRQVAGYVDQRMRQLAQGRHTTTLDIALVTALNIASEYWKLRDEQEEVRQTVNRVVQRVLNRLGSCR